MIQTHLLLASAVVMLSVGVTMLIVLIAVVPSGPLRVALIGYARRINADLLFLRKPANAARVIGFQVFGALAVAGLSVMTIGTFWVLLPLVIAAPIMHLHSARTERVQRIEQQLDGWLLVLANALKAVPALGDALSSSQALMHAPISEELDIALKEYRLGTPLDRALQSMADRVGSRVVRTAVTTLQVARRTGGNLPLTLESSASSLREMARLEGVVRTKTADGRNQALVIGTLPAVLIILLYFVHPDLLMPLVTTTTGNILLGIAVALWIAAVLLAMRILKVDL